MTLSYFLRAELPTDPALRFTDLFLTRERSKSEDIVPYLSDIVVDSNDLDKLLLKYARPLTDKDGLWYTARARWVEKEYCSLPGHSDALSAC